MARSNYIVLCSAVLPKSLKTISQATVDVYEDDDYSLLSFEQSVRNKNRNFDKIIEALKVTEQEIEIENLIINVTIAHVDLNKYHLFSL